MNDRRDRAQGARHRPRLSRRAGAGGRRAHAARRRSARAHGTERRRQVHTDQGADRRVRARRRAASNYWGNRCTPRSPLHAQELGISAVHQESHLLPNLSVAENICAGRYPRRPWIARRRHRLARNRTARARVARRSRHRARRDAARGRTARRPAAARHRGARRRHRCARADPRRTDLEPRRRRGPGAVRADPATCATRASRSCSSRTSSTRSTRSAIASPCCATAGSSANTPAPNSMRAAWSPRWSGAELAAAERSRDARHPPLPATRRPCSPRSNLSRRGQLKPMDIELRARRSAGPRRLVRLRPHRTRAAAVRARRARLGRHPHRRQAGEARAIPRMRCSSAWGSAPRIASTAASSPNCRCARTSRWRCRRAWVSRKFLTLTEQRTDRGEAGGGAGREDREHRDAHRPALGRQPAEGHHRALARHASARADPRRTHARHRRRRQAGTHERDPGAGARRHRRVVHLGGDRGSGARLGSHHGAARPRQGRRVAARRR